jgi:hypothetical protein
MHSPILRFFFANNGHFYGGRVRPPSCGGEKPMGTFFPHAVARKSRTRFKRSMPPNSRVRN